MNLQTLWELVCEKLRPQLSPQSFSLWIASIKPQSLDGETVVLKTESALHKSFTIAQFKEKIIEAFEDVVGFKLAVEIICDEDEMTVKEKEKVPSLRPTSEISLFSFDNFMVGESNKYAYNICRAVAENPGTLYNPLFLHGSTGLGKTHLLKAIKTQIEKEHPDYKCIYISSEGFTTELVESIRNKTTQEFKNKFRSADVLLIDDVHFFAGKDSTQEEFFHTYNSLMEGNKQIILASDRPPKDIHPLEERLAGRFEAGMITSIQTPELELKVAIVKSKALHYNIVISDEVAYFIAETIKTNIRKIEGVINKMKADQYVNGHNPTINSVRRNINDIIEENEPTPILIDKVIIEVSRNYDLKPEDIKSRKRTMKIKDARHIAIYIIRELTSVSLDEIGSAFSNLDHSSVHHAISKVTERMEKDTSFRIEIEDIIRNIKEK